MKTLLVLLFCLLTISAKAATINAATANISDVQTAVNTAVNGDVVLVPSGNVGWGSALNISSKSISLIGNGIGSTIITDAVSAVTGSTLINWTAVTNSLCMLSGFEFRGQSGQSNPNNGLITAQGTSFLFRVCSNYFNGCHNRSFQWHGWLYGVHDHNIQRGSFLQYAEVWHDGYGGGTYGDKSYTDLTYAGTTNAIYFETNLFLETSSATPGMIDMMGGARVVVRFNTFSNCTLTTHGTESTGRQRSVRWLESYNNTFKETSGFSSTSGQFRGGSGIVCSNTYTGPDWAFGMTLTCYREIYSFSHWGAANGTNGYDVNSSTIYDSGTHNGSAGATVLTDSTKSWTVNQWASTNILWNKTKNMASRITANTATTITYDLNGSSVAGGSNMTFDSGDVYEIRAVLIALDQPGRGFQTNSFTSNSDPAVPQTWPGQTLEPLYSWSNTVNGVLGMNISSSYPTIKSGKEYFQNTISPTWTPLSYPHPLANMNSIITAATPTITTINAVNGNVGTINVSPF